MEWMKDMIDTCSYQSVHLQKNVVIERLRNQGFRITKQRELLMDIILNETCSCCKEVYVLAAKKDPGIGIATVYRMVEALEQVGALKRSAAYELCSQEDETYQKCLVELEDSSTVTFDYTFIEKIIEQEMQNCGLSKGKKIKSITLL